MPSLSTYLNWTPILEWCLLLFSKINHHKVMCLEEIGACATSLLTKLGSIPSPHSFRASYMVVLWYKHFQLYKIMEKTQDLKKFHGLLLNSHDIHISKKIELEI